MKLLPGRTENSVKNRFNCMFKKIKDEKLLKIQESNMTEALSKIDQESQHEALIDEDEIIELLINQKTHEKTNKKRQEEEK